LLAAVDRSSPKGKRDYAMLLLACRLGLRVSDIRTLRLEHLHWHVAELRLTQSKTEVPLTLPLSEEVGHALIDYLRHAVQTAVRTVQVGRRHSGLRLDQASSQVGDEQASFSPADTCSPKLR
jgi:integrase